MPTACYAPRRQGGIGELPHSQGNVDPLLHQVDVPIVQHHVHFQIWMARKELR
jgi:hypothetical protein